MMTLDEIREKRKAWETEQERLWRAFRASWTPDTGGIRMPRSSWPGSRYGSIGFLPSESEFTEW
ncbi:MAG: hypothetical protein Q8N45_12040 [Anaerolineales bacterium]|nr:hypothetical protein [Anaerolineales bacterium]